ncbi:hypothetical protein J5Y09_19960 [Roseomonas sp. PWR1]|uniref:Uncharacterized protein n=1 Tax=Roseomonas nitratireducens TaxID=2820810 RepID=A0ABS4B061_9PROT|nr:hypothetical protein [Neoroseomonas nitratireducens]MBP0466212.1 hypothetical protein [Neoroseomonas nitratireducens]
MIGAISDRARISAVIGWQEAAGYGFRNALYRAVLAGDLALVELLPRSRLPREALWSKAPTVIVVGDDAGISSGPADFPDAGRLFPWAPRVMIHAAGGELRHYEWVVAAAQIFRRVLLIETTTAAEPAWMDLAERERDRRASEGLPPLGVLLIQVPEDLPPHPVPPSWCRGDAP